VTWVTDWDATLAPDTFELESQILIAKNLGYLRAQDAGFLLDRIAELGRILNGLLKSLN
jgi:four helix bundle protein